MDANRCQNTVSIDENELTEVIERYFTNILKNKKNVTEYAVNEFQKEYRAVDENSVYEKELRTAIEKLRRSRQKYIDMYTDDLITREELNDKIGKDKQEMNRLQEELNSAAKSRESNEVSVMPETESEADTDLPEAQIREDGIYIKVLPRDMKKPQAI